MGQYLQTHQYYLPNSLGLINCNGKWLAMSNLFGAVSDDRALSSEKIGRRKDLYGFFNHFGGWVAAHRDHTSIRQENGGGVIHPCFLLSGHPSPGVCGGIIHFRLKYSIW